MKGISSFPTKLRVAYASMAPFVDVKTFEGEDILEGFMPDILSRVATWMNLELTFIREPFDKYGAWENNTWSGLIGMVYRNEVDIILNPILPREEYLEFIYFTNPITVEAFTVLSGKEAEEAGLFLYFSVLDKKVWFSIIIILILVSATTGALLMKGSTASYRWIKAMGQSCWNLISYMLKQVPAEKWLMRKNKQLVSIFVPLIVMLWVFGISFLVMNTIQSLLVSKMTLKKFTPVVDTLADLVKKKSVICLAPREIQIDHILKYTHVPVNKEALKKMNHDISQETMFSQKVLQEVEEGKYCAIHGHLVFESRLSHFYKRRGKCNLHLSNKYFYPFSLLILVHRKIPPSFYNTFNLGITRLVDADISGRWLSHALQVSNLCTSYSDNTLKPLGLKHIGGVFVMWGCGLFLSTVVFLVEFLLPKYKKLAYSTNRTGSNWQRRKY